jgi:hypothetical protein
MTPGVLSVFNLLVSCDLSARSNSHDKSRKTYEQETVALGCVWLALLCLIIHRDVELKADRAHSRG